MSAFVGALELPVLWFASRPTRDLDEGFVAARCFEEPFSCVFTEDVMGAWGQSYELTRKVREATFPNGYGGRQTAMPGWLLYLALRTLDSDVPKMVELLGFLANVLTPEEVVSLLTLCALRPESFLSVEQLGHMAASVIVAHAAESAKP